MPRASAGGVVDAVPGPLAPANFITLFRMLRIGRSFSGHERKCMFLNTGGPRWACVSAAAGVDTADDGRAVALLDWDHDGAMDFWMVNRSGPQIRFFHNEAPGMGHFLDLRLVGKTANRDGIGARVEVSIAGQGKRYKTLHAGEGYLAQSSKWLHFGLGGSAGIEKVVVRWPYGAAEEFSGLTGDARFVLRQGTGKAELWTSPARTVALVPSTIPEATGTMIARRFFPARVPMPALSYEDFAGKNQPWPNSAEGPLLVNLWASWCKPCLAELKDFTAHAAELRGASLRILALAVNGVGESGKGDPRAAQKWMEDAKFPFTSARATKALMDRVEILVSGLFAMQYPLPVPTSLLLDAKGELAALYRGPVDVKQLLADIANLPAEGEKLRALALPFPGRWRMPPPRPPLLELAEAFLKNGDLEPGEMYYHTGARAILGDATLSFQFARSLIKRGNWEAACPEIKKSVDLRPNEPTARYTYAVVLMKLNRYKEALPQVEATIEMRPDYADAYVQLGMIQSRLGQVDKAVAAFQKALQLNPDHPDATSNLGAMYRGQGKLKESEEQYRKALVIDPQWAHAHYCLGVLLAMQDKFEEAYYEFEQTRIYDRLYPMEMENVLRVRSIVEQRRRAGGK